MATINNTAFVADAPLTASGVPVRAIAGQLFAGVVATFTDANPAGQVSDFTAQIDWGQGQTSTGTVLADPSTAGQFDVTGTFTNDNRGSFPLGVTITDAGGAIVVAAALITEVEYQPPYWVHAVLWLPLILIVTLGPLRPMKGLMIALQFHHKAAEGRVQAADKS